MTKLKRGRPVQYATLPFRGPGFCHVGLLGGTLRKQESTPLQKKKKLLK